MGIMGYDFDKTIYYGDSSTHFALWCFARFPKTWLSLGTIIFACAMYKLKLWDKTRFKSKIFSFLKGIPDVDRAVSEFWRTHEHKLKSWYIIKPHQDDVIISASPEFLLRDICAKIGVKSLIATDMDKKTGVILGKNCYGAEKVLRFHALYPNCSMVEFYSDSRSDSPLAEISEKAFLVDIDNITPW